MAERRDEILAGVALGLVTLLMMAQGAVLAIAAIAPLASTAAGLASEDAETAPLEPVAHTGPWALVCLLMTAVSAGVGVWALVRMQRGTHVQGRWTWALVLAGVGCVWGLFTWRMLAALAAR
ncbi:MAG TPA: hypothetical protein VM283_08815 [Armatimonadota bacterium]|nr:hypothetical protein [Armatimonadota bacterium]